MANTIPSALAPLIMGEALEYLRNNNQFLASLTMDYQTEAMEIGETINVGGAPDLTAGNFTAANVAPSASDITVPSKTITLDQHKVVEFSFSEADFRNNDLSSTFRQTIRSATSAIVNNVNLALWNQYTKIPYAVGNSGTGFFASNIDGLADVDKLLTQNKCPLENRMAMLHLKDYAALLKIDNVQAANTYGGTEVMRRGVIQDVLGFMVMRDQQAPTHTIGTITGTVTASAAAIGATSVTLTCATGEAVDLQDGDIVEFGDGNSYAAQGDVSIAAEAVGTITLDRGLVAALAGTEAIALATTDSTYDASSLVQVAGDFKGIGCAARIPKTNVAGIDMQGTHFNFADPQTGWPMQLSFFGQDGKVMIRLSTIYGLQIMQSSRLVRILTTSS